MVTAFGSITLIDMTDAGEFSAYPTANKALSVIYSPDEKDNNKKYSPNWTTESPLILTPNLFYAGNSKSPTSTGVGIKWYKQVGSSSEVQITDGISNGVLTITSLELNSDSPQITYILEATYQDATTGNQLIRARGQLTFNLITMPSGLRSLKLKGANVFIKAANQSEISPSSVTITAEKENIIIDGWYLDGVSLNNTSDTQVISSDKMANSSYKLLTVKGHDEANNEQYEDSLGIYKVSDGVSDSAFNIVLSNETQMIPCDKNGNFATGYFTNNNINTTVYIYDGVENISDNCDIEISLENVTGHWVYSGSATGEPDGDNLRTYRIDNLTADIGSVLFSVYGKTTTGGHPNHTDEAPIAQKKMTLSKVKVGQDGAKGTSPTIYEITTNVTSAKLSYSESYDANGVTVQSGGTYTPSLTTIVVTSTSQTGNANKVSFAGYRTYSIDGGSETAFTATSPISSMVKPTKNITFKLYDNNTSSKKLLDSQTVTILSDGKLGNKGDTGQDGKNAINVICGNPSDTFNVNANYHMSKTVEIPIEVYSGVTKLTYNTHYSISAGQLFGVAATISDGKITYVIPNTAACGSSSNKNGTVSIVVSGKSGTDYAGVSSIINYSWAVVPQPANGTSPYFLQITTPSGYVFQDQTGELTAVAQLYYGSSTSSTTYTWKKWSGSGYTETAPGGTNPAWSANGATLTVKGAAVNGSTSFECATAHGEKGYIGFIDKTDPITCELFSTFGDVIKTGQTTKGLIYCRVYKNGYEINKINSISFDSSKNNATGATISKETTSGISVKYLWSYGQYQSNGSYTPLASPTIVDGVVTNALNSAVSVNDKSYTVYTDVPYVYIDNLMINNKIVVDCKVEVTNI